MVGHITCPRNKRMAEASRRQRRMAASSEGGGQGPDGVVASCMDGWMDGWRQRSKMGGLCSTV